MDLLDFWVAEEKSRDRDRRLVAGSGPTLLIDAATRLGETLTQHRDRDHDVFGTELLRTTDRLIESAENTGALPACIAANAFPDPQSELAQAREQIVVAARALCAEYVKERPGWSPVGDLCEERQSLRMRPRSEASAPTEWNGSGRPEPAVNACFQSRNLPTGPRTGLTGDWPRKGSPR